MAFQGGTDDGLGSEVVSAGLPALGYRLFLFAVAVPMTATVAANEAGADQMGPFRGSGSGVLGFGVVWSWYRHDWLSVVAAVFGLLVCHECFKANRLSLGPFWTTSVTSIWLISR